jgi:hypothetical protein
MATFASKSTGLGYSRVFIADDADLEIPVMQAELDRTISFIRVMKWFYPSKKGWCSSGSNRLNEIDLTASTWWYSWGAGENTGPNQEYVPIKQNNGWPSSSTLLGKNNVSHLLGLNEPDRSDQANSTVADAVAKMPELLSTGLRLGSPAIADNLSWLYSFMDECKKNSYRVDYVAIHAYWGGSGGAYNTYTNGQMDINKWYNRLKEIHTRTGRPLWITEWNNGANWTNESWPSGQAEQEAKQLSDLRQIINMMDTCSFIERYSIYNWVEDKRALVKTPSSGAQYLTPAGEFYRDNPSAPAFNRAKEVIPEWQMPVPEILSFTLTNSNMKLNLPTSDFDELFASYIVEEKFSDGAYREIQNISNQPVVNSLTFTVGMSQSGQYFYRIRIVDRGGDISEPSNEVSFAVSSASNIQMGKPAINTSDWTSVYFGQSFATSPVTILGVPTNNNMSVLMSNRIRNVSTSRMQLRFYPWSYLTVSFHTADEMPYLFLPAGNYDLDGIKAIAATASAVNGEWNAVTFPEGYFTETPIVIPTQVSSVSASATSIHLRNVTPNGFEVCLRHEDAKTYTISNETIHFVAFGQGSGTIQGRKIRTGLVENVGHTTANAVTFAYGDVIADPLIFAHKQTANNDFASNLRILSYSDTEARMMNQIERSGAYDLTASTDKAGWVVIDEKPSALSVETLRATTFCVYPNPVSDILYFDNSTNEEITVKIVNLQGIIVKQETGRISQIKVDNLLSGMYFVSINGKTQKIVKK